jgi:hypothetical protein
MKQIQVVQPDMCPREVQLLEHVGMNMSLDSVVWLYIDNLKAERASACCLLGLLFDPEFGGNSFL